MALGSIDQAVFDLILTARDEASATIHQAGAAFGTLSTAMERVMALTPGFDRMATSEHEATRGAREMDSALSILGERAGEASRRLAEASGATEHFHEGLRRASETARGFVFGALGFEALNQAQIGVESLGRGLIEANASAESMTQTMAAIYHSGAEAQQAVAWMNQFALAAPFTRESIMQASTTIAALGMDITQVIPSLGNLAAVMGQTMPVAAQAFMDAYEGRFQMLQRDLHVSKQQLEQYGLQISATGQIVQSTFAPAFERFVAANYPHAMALQMKTFNGQMSNATDQFQNFERIAGHGIFEKLKQETMGLLTYLQANQNAVNVFAATLGGVLGGALDVVFRGVHAVISALPGMINLWNNVTDAIRGPLAVAWTIAEGAVASFANFLSVMVLPRVALVLTTMMGWWSQHGASIIANLQVIAGDIGTWFGWILDHASVFFQLFQGQFQVGWSVVTNLFLGALDLLSGKWAAFGNDMIRLLGGVLTGIIPIVAGIEKIFIGLLISLQGPLNSAFHAIHQAWVAVADGILLVFVGVETTAARIMNAVIGKMNDFIALVETGLTKLPLIGNEFSVHHDTFGKGLDVNTIATNILSMRKSFEDAVGLPADKTMTYGKTEKQADAAVDARAAELIKNVGGNYTALTGQRFDQASGGGMVQGPRFDPMANLLAEFKKLTSGPGLVLDMSKSDSITKWLGGLLTVPQLTGADTTKAEKAAAVIKEDRAKFEYDLLTGASTKTLKGDIAQIVKDMTAAGSDKYETGIEYLRDLAQIAKDGKKDSSAVLAALNMQFEFDRNVAHPSATTLHKDELAILAEMGRTGSTALQIAREKQILDAQLARGVTTTNATEAGAGRHYFGVNPRDLPGSGAGFGQSLVAFGSGANAQAESVNLLRQQLAAALRREAKDERQIALLEAQLAAETRVADGIRTMLAGDAGGVHRGFKRAGIAHPVAR